MLDLVYKTSESDIYLSAALPHLLDTSNPRPK